MRVRLKMGWGQWSKGHVFEDMPGGQARMLISRGIAEEFKDEPVARAFKSPADRMIRPARTVTKS